MEENKSIKDELKEIKQALEDSNRDNKSKKPRPFKLPFKAVVNPGKLKKGYLTIVKIEDNMAVDFTREPIIDGTVKLEDTYHAIEEFDIYNYRGKPLIFQPKSKLNPYNPFRTPLEGENETYGQKYVMARMEGERITAKKQLGWGIGIFVIIGIIALGVYALVTGGAG